MLALITGKISKRRYGSFSCIAIVSIIIYTISYSMLMEHNISIGKTKIFQDDSEELRKLHPNVPFEFLHNKKNKIVHSCGLNLHPNDTANNNQTANNVSGILINNDYWQKCETEFGILYLYSAYYDSRRKTTLGPTIQIIAMADRLLIDDIKLDCLMWDNENGDPLVSNKRVDITAMTQAGDWKSDKSRTPENYRPYLLTCYVPQHKNDQVPSTVSIIESDDKRKNCYNPSNYLKVVHNSKKGKDMKTFAVCVKGLYVFEDISIRLIEWIELVRLMGGSQIFFYVLHMPDTVEHVLNYYASKGLVVFTKTTLPGNQPNEPTLQNKYLKEAYYAEIYNELIHLNDCFYRNIYRYEYVVNEDIDDIVMPRNGTWFDLLPYFEKDKCSHSISVVSFFENLSPSGKWTGPTKTEKLNKKTEGGRAYMHMLKHVYRSQNITELVKSFMKTDRVKTTNNHLATSCLDSEKIGCPEKRQLLKSNIALAHHYRKGCRKLSRMSKEECYRDYQKHLVKDTTIFAFKKQLQSNCLQTIKELNI